MSCAAIAKGLLDDGTIRTWHRSYGADGIEGLANCGYEGSACRLTEANNPVWDSVVGRPDREKGRLAS